MRNPTTPALEKLRAGMAKSSAPVSAGSVYVGGNVEGNIVVGNNNYVYSVHNHYGAVVNKHAAPSVKRRKSKQQPPRRTSGFIGRAGELGRLDGSINNRDAILVYGHDGLGKTALVRQAANGEPAMTMQDGVVFLRGVDEKGGALGVQDTIQLLFDALFESNPPLKVTASSARTYLSNTQPLAVLNRFEFSATGLDTLADMLPKGALMITSRGVPSGDSLQHLPLAPLAHEEAIQLLVTHSGITPDDRAQKTADRVCELLGDVPLAISRIADLLRENRIAPRALVGQLETIQPPSMGDKIQSAIERGYGLAYSVLENEERQALAIAAAAPGISVDRAWLESMVGGEKTGKALESLGLLQANSPRLGLDEGMRQIVQNSRTDLKTLREALLYYLEGQLKSRALDFDFLHDELGNLLGLIKWAFTEKRWSDVIILSRAVDPYLTLHGLWDAWKEVLNQILVAGQRLKDEAVQAWALHQLGSREMGIGNQNQAIDLLVRALRMRESLGDTVGAAYTRHNLDLILPPAPPEKPRGDEPYPPQQPRWIQWLRRWIVPVLVGAAAVVAIFIIATSRTPRPIDCPAMPEGWQLYRVRAGETLDSITQRVAIAMNKELDEKQLAVLKLAIAKGNCQDSPTQVEDEAGKGIYVPALPVEPVALATPTQALPTREGAAAEAYLRLDISGKLQNAETFERVGDVIEYSYEIVNTGSQPLPGPLTVNDDKATTVCPEVITLTSDERVTCTGTYTITQVDLDLGWVTNVALASIDNTRSNQATFTVKGEQNVAITLSKSADPITYNDINQKITYTYTITNAGNVALSPVQFTVGDDHINGYKQFNCGPEAAALAPNGTLTCSATYLITQADIAAKSVTNTAYANMYGLGREVFTSPKVSTTIQYALPVTLTKTADRKTYDQAGQTIIYTYTIQNVNSVPLIGPAQISDDRVPAGNITCEEFKTLEPNGTVICKGTYSVTQADLDTGSVTNTAKARLDGTESSEVTVTINAELHPALEITKSANPTSYGGIGQAITYTYAITNTGNVTLDATRLKVQDDHINGNAPFPCDSGKTQFAPKETITCTATYNITEADTDAGSVTNGATATVVYGEQSVSSSRATSTISYTCPPPPAGWAIYTILRGDTLSDISSRYGITILELQRANCLGLSNIILAGKTLYVPYLSSITGIVFTDPNGDGKQQDFGEPVLVGFPVTIMRVGSSVVIPEARTNASGFYSFPNLLPGNYLVLSAPVNLPSRETVIKNFGLRPVP